MNRIRNVQILFLLGAAALLSACTSVTTTVPSGRAPAFEARADQVLDFIKMRTAPGDIVKVERDFIAHLGLAVTVRDPKVSAYRWWNAQAVSDNFAHATARNLAQQAAEPSDLETPRALGDPNPQAAIGAVDRYQRGSVRPFGDVSLEAGGGKSK